VIRAADKILQKVPKPIPLFKRFHLPLAAAELRRVRLKTPLPLDPALLREKERMLAELREVRERTLAFIDETRGRDLSAYRWRHPFLGSLSAYEWFSLIASHEIRHEKQLREIATRLPKAIAHSQK
jgi:DinB family protein